MKRERKIDRVLRAQAITDHPLRERMERYMASLKEERRLQPKSLSHYRQELQILLERLQTPDSVFGIKDHLRPLASATYSRKLMIWRAFLRECGDPWKSALDSLQSPKVRRKDPIFLTDEEVFLLEQACFRSSQIARNRLFVALALQLGLRLSEILGLKFKDIEGDWLRLMRKGAKEQRLPLSPSLQTLLKQWRDESLSQPEDWIFGGIARLGRSEALSARAAQILLKQLAKIAGITKRLSPHALRHTFATKLASTGVNLAALKEILGHENITTTEKYLHITPSHLQDALGIRRQTTSSQKKVSPGSDSLSHVAPPSP